MPYNTMTMIMTQDLGGRVVRDVPVDGDAAGDELQNAIADHIHDLQARSQDVAPVC